MFITRAMTIPALDPRRHDGGSLGIISIMLTGENGCRARVFLHARRDSISVHVLTGESGVGSRCPSRNLREQNAGDPELDGVAPCVMLRQSAW